MMKRRIVSLLLTLCVLGALLAGTCVLAAEPQLPSITDEAGLLTETQLQRLTQLAESVAQKYDFGVYVVTIDDYRVIDPAGVYEATYGVYHGYTMGVGEQRQGIMLLLSMDARDYALFCYGNKAEYTFNEYGLAQLEKGFLSCFAEDDWAGGLECYIRDCSSYLEQAEAGKPVSKSPVGAILLVCALALLVAAIVCAVLVGQMKTVHRKTTANAYAANGLAQTEQYDQFTHRTETRRRIERSSSGSGHSESGGGGSGRSGKF